MKDWMARALKTFVQAFLGVLIPQLVLILQNGLPETGIALRTALLPVVSAALAAAISAVWNLLLESEKQRKE